MARRTGPSRLELKRQAGSFSNAPAGNVIFTTALQASPVRTMPPCDPAKHGSDREFQRLAV